MACSAPVRDFDRRGSVQQAVEHLSTRPDLLDEDRRACVEAVAASSSVDLKPTADPILGLVKAGAMARDQRAYATCLEQRGYTVIWPSPPPR